MENWILIVILVASFIGVPSMILYMVVIKDYKKIKACSEEVIGRILSIRKESRVTRGKYGKSVRYVEIATCEYEYADNTYESEVCVPAGKYNLHEGGTFEFAINPQNPYQAIKKQKRNTLYVVIVVSMLSIFIIAGICISINIILSGDEVTTEVRKSDSDSRITPAPSSSTGSSDEDNDKQKEIEAIIKAKTGDYDASKEYLKSVIPAKIGNVSMYLPNSYKLIGKKGNVYSYGDPITEEKLAIVVGKTTKDKTLERVALRRYIYARYKVSDSDEYAFNGNEYEVYTQEGNSTTYMLFCIAVNDKTKIMMTYKSSNNSAVDFRDILSSIRF